MLRYIKIRTGVQSGVVRNHNFFWRQSLEPVLRVTRTSADLERFAGAEHANIGGFESLELL